MLLQHNNDNESDVLPRISSSVLIDCGPHRTMSRTVSWNNTGMYLAIGSSCSTVRLWTIDTATASSKEVLTVTGHTAGVTHVRFHPTEQTQLCSAARDGTVRLWDIRGATQRSLGKLELTTGGKDSNIDTRFADIQWNPIQTHIVVVRDFRGTFAVYDVRKFNKILHSSELNPDAFEPCIFDPISGDYIIAASTYNTGESNMASLKVWNWKKDNTKSIITSSSSSSYPAHAGPIYALTTSPDKHKLATGGADACVGIWDVQNMCCVTTITRRTKFIRGLSFSHDSKMLAISSEEGTIDIASTNLSGEQITLAGLTAQRQSQQQQTLTSTNLATSDPRSTRGPGAEEIVFHPSQYLLACARASDGMHSNSPVTVAKFTLQ